MTINRSNISTTTDGADSTLTSLTARSRIKPSSVSSPGLLPRTPMNTHVGVAGSVNEPG